LTFNKKKETKKKKREGERGKLALGNEISGVG